ncbi:hypothetical protein Tco_0083754 [Tanacetum coccineum]
MIRVIHILNPTAYKEREEMEGQDEKEKKDREDRGELKLGAWSLYWSWMAAETPRVLRAVGQLIGLD